MLWKKDIRILETLGPFAFALLCVSSDAQGSRKMLEVIFPNLSVAFASTFITMRGAKMKEEWMASWTKNIGNTMFAVPGLTSTTRNPNLALEFS